MSEHSPSRAEEEAGIVSTVFVWVALATFGVPLAIIGWQVYRWLRDGFWTRLPIDGWLYERGIITQWTDWVGIQRMIDWVLGLPLAFGVFVAGFGLICVIHPFYERTQARIGLERQARAKKLR